MEYPIYNKKKSKSLGFIILVTMLLGVVMSLVLPWFIYIEGSLIFILMSIFMYKKSRGFKRVCGMFISLLFMLIVFDFVDLNFTWSLDYVFPSFLLFIMITLILTVLFRKKTWINNYDTHMYTLMISVLMMGLMFLGIITSVPLVIVTLSFAVLSMIVIRLRVGNRYERNIGKFMHI
ncbi:MAG: hypothetical protein JEZ08_07985 [Clostridiales bacterium]|nr:hypothetical protein [Clostridiales bacterium]